VASTLKFVVEDPSSNRAQWALAEYIRDVTQTAGLTQLDLQAGVRDVAEYRAPTGVFLLGLFDEEAVACIGLRRRNDVEAEIKRMWVSPAVRGRGVGATLLAEVEARATELGYARVVLDTNGALTPAMRLYRTHGYTPIERYNDNADATHFFAKQLR
jgi:GNAT superfamily N-acetyltransferase